MNGEKVSEKKEEKHIIISKKIAILVKEIQILEELVDKIDNRINKQPGEEPGLVKTPLNDVLEDIKYSHLGDFLNIHPNVLEQLSNRILSIRDRLQAALF